MSGSKPELVKSKGGAQLYREARPTIAANYAGGNPGSIQDDLALLGATINMLQSAIDGGGFVSVDKCKGVLAELRDKAETRPPLGFEDVYCDEIAELVEDLIDKLERNANVFKLVAMMRDFVATRTNLHNAETARQKLLMEVVSVRQIDDVFAQIQQVIVEEVTDLDTKERIAKRLSFIAHTIPGR